MKRELVKTSNYERFRTGITAVENRGAAEATSLDVFRRDFDQIVARHGWDYNGGRNWRSKVIFETNIRTAYMAGRYKQMTDPDVLQSRPFWEYKHGDSLVPRPQHKAWDGLILPATDPWWQTHYAPNGWGCKCKIFTRSARDLKRMGKTGPDQAPPIEYQDKKLGTAPGAPVVRVPKGIDPGWGYNVGEAAWGRNQAARLMEDQGPWRDFASRGPAQFARPAEVPVDAARARLGSPARIGADGAVDEAVLRHSLKRAIDADDDGQATFIDPAGVEVTVTQAIVDHMLIDPTRQDGRDAYFPFIPELIEDPYEIWLNFARSEASGRIALRRRYVKMIDLGRDRVLGLYAELQEGQWVSGDFFRGGRTGVRNLRRGRLLWGRE